MNDDVTDLDRWNGKASPHDEARAAFAAQFIPAGAVVLDIGCGAMALERALPPGCHYQPCDRTARDHRTILSDLAAGEVADAAAAEADIVTLLGVVEYLPDVAGAMARLAAHGAALVFSYRPLQGAGGAGRHDPGRINHHSLDALAAMAAGAGYALSTAERITEREYLLVARPAAAASAPPKRVAVVSYSNVGNFGDRLGYHLMQTVLPPSVEVEHFHFNPWTAKRIQSFDLVVVGIGNSLFAPVLTDELQAMVEGARRSIGIFGTQYRATLPRERLARLLGGLDMWFARSQEDLLLFGEHARAVTHLGDWLIDAFPMSRPVSDQRLVVGQEIWANLPLDRTIQQIQLHRRVYSPRLHPLLCALTSAEVVEYAEQREMGGEEVSGKFRSMLHDVFGRTYPEAAAWRVDRPKVAAYKEKVAANVAALRRYIAEALYAPT